MVKLEGDLEFTLESGTKATPRIDNISTISSPLTTTIKPQAQEYVPDVSDCRRESTKPEVVKTHCRDSIETLQSTTIVTLHDQIVDPNKERGLHANNMSDTCPSESMDIHRSEVTLVANGLPKDTNSGQISDSVSVTHEILEPAVLKFEVDMSDTDKRVDNNYVMDIVETKPRENVPSLDMDYTRCTKFPPGEQEYPENDGSKATHLSDNDGGSNRSVVSNHTDKPDINNVRPMAKSHTLPVNANITFSLDDFTVSKNDTSMDSEDSDMSGSSAGLRDPPSTHNARDDTARLGPSPTFGTEPTYSSKLSKMNAMSLPRSASYTAISERRGSHNSDGDGGNSDSEGKKTGGVVMRPGRRESLVDALERQRRESTSSRLKGLQLPSTASRRMSAGPAVGLPTIVGMRTSQKPLLPSVGQRTSYQPVTESLKPFSLNTGGKDTKGLTKSQSHQDRLETMASRRMSAPVIKPAFALHLSNKANLNSSFEGESKETEPFTEKTVDHTKPEVKREEVMYEEVGVQRLPRATKASIKSEVDQASKARSAFGENKNQWDTYTIAESPTSSVEKYDTVEAPSRLVEKVPGPELPNVQLLDVHADGEKSTMIADEPAITLANNVPKTETSVSITTTTLRPVSPLRSSSPLLNEKIDNMESTDIRPKPAVRSKPRVTPKPLIEIKMETAGEPQLSPRLIPSPRSPRSPHSPVTKVPQKTSAIRSDTFDVPKTDNVEVAYTPTEDVVLPSGDNTKKQEDNLSSNDTGDAPPFPDLPPPPIPSTAPPLPPVTAPPAPFCDPDTTTSHPDTPSQETDELSKSAEQFPCEYGTLNRSSGDASVTSSRDSVLTSDSDLSQLKSTLDSPNLDLTPPGKKTSSRLRTLEDLEVNRNDAHASPEVAPLSPTPSETDSGIGSTRAESKYDADTETKHSDPTKVDTTRIARHYRFSSDEDNQPKAQSPQPSPRGRVQPSSDAASPPTDSASPTTGPPTCQSTVGDRQLMTVELIKGSVGLGFCIEGGAGSPLGDRPIMVKRLFKGGAAAQGVLKPGDEIVSANGKDFNKLTHFTAWNFLKSLPEGAISMQICRKD